MEVPHIVTRSPQCHRSMVRTQNASMCFMGHKWVEALLEIIAVTTSRCSPCTRFTASLQVQCVTATARSTVMICKLKKSKSCREQQLQLGYTSTLAWTLLSSSVNSHYVNLNHFTPRKVASYIVTSGNKILFDISVILLTSSLPLSCSVWCVERDM